MPALRNSDTGYGTVTKFLHWLTAVVMLGQFVLGYGMEGLSEWLSGGDADELLVFAHAWVGGAILAIAVVRFVWRWSTPLPPWSERLSESDRKLENWTERAFYVLLIVIPGTGLALLFLSGEQREIGNDQEWRPPFDIVDDGVLLAAHIASHIAFYVVLAVHVGLALRRRTLSRLL